MENREATASVPLNQPESRRCRDSAGNRHSEPSRVHFARDLEVRKMRSRRERCGKAIAHRLLGSSAQRRNFRGWNRAARLGLSDIFEAARRNYPSLKIARARVPGRKSRELVGRLEGGSTILHGNCIAVLCCSPL